MHALLNSLTYFDITDNYFECADACWSQALWIVNRIEDEADWNLIVCGGTHYPTMTPTEAPTASPCALSPQRNLLQPLQLVISILSM